jgi:hypothetical protein
LIDPHFAEAPARATDRTLRQFAGLWVVVFAALACWQYLGRGHQTAATLLAVLAVGVGLPGLAWPAFIRPVFTTATAVTYPIGWVVSHLVLGALYYGVFTPVALWFRLTGRDALARRKRPDLSSHWVPKATPADVRSYFRQS